MRILENTVSQPITRMGFTPDGRTLVAGGSGGFNVWDVIDGTFEFIPTPTPKDTSIFAFVVDPLGRWLYYSEPRCRFRIYPLPTGEFRQLPGSPHDQHVISLAASHDGAWLAVSRGAVGNNRLECWAIGVEGELAVLWEVRAPRDTVSFFGLAFTKDNSKIVSVEPTRTAQSSCPVVLRDIREGAFQAHLGTIPYMHGLRMVLSPDGERLLAWGDYSRELWGWTLSNRRQVGPVAQPGRANIRGIAIHPSGTFFATPARSGVIRFWDLETFQPTKNALNWKVGPLQSIAFSPDGMLGAVGNEEGKIVLWDIT